MNTIAKPVSPRQIAEQTLENLKAAGGGPDADDRDVYFALVLSDSIHSAQTIYQPPACSRRLPPVFAGETIAFCGLPAAQATRIFSS